MTRGNRKTCLSPVFSCAHGAEISQSPAGIRHPLGNFENLASGSAGNCSSWQPLRQIVTPIFWQSRSGNSFFKQRTVVFVSDEEPIHFRDGDNIRLVAHPFEGVSGLHDTFLLD